jgi:hypothetical protein
MCEHAGVIFIELTINSETFQTFSGLKKKFFWAGRGEKDANFGTALCLECVMITLR